MFIESEVILFDYAVDTFVSASPDGASCILAAAAVAHLNEEFNDNILE